MSTSPLNPAALRACSACGALNASRFCGECGQPLAPDTGAPVEILREGAGELFGFDIRPLARTLRDLLLHPARVARAHLEGEPGVYVRPLRLFFSLGGLYMLLLSWIQPLAFDPQSLLSQGVSPEHVQSVARLMEERGISTALFNARFQERMNAVTPLVVALALLPTALVLRVVGSRRPVRDHVIFLLCLSNAIWLISLALLPLARLSTVAHGLLLHVLMYGYLGLGFFAIYRGRSRLTTGLRFAAFATADLVVTYAASILLMVAVYVSVLFL